MYICYHINNATHWCICMHNMVNEKLDISWLILGLRPANERRRYKVSPSLIGWAQT